MSLRLEEPEHAVVAALELVPAAVDVGRYPAHGPAIALAQEVLGLGMVEERVLPRRGTAALETAAAPLLRVAVRRTGA
jgi:hypothetical protein